MSNSDTYIFAGGGTGGHLFPAIAIAERIVEREPAARFLFLCSDRAIDADILAGQRIVGKPIRHQSLPARPPVARPIPFAQFLASWGPSVRATRQAIQESRRDGRAFVVAMGGFVAAPAAQAAAVERALLGLVNLDAVPGKANRWIATRVRRADGVILSAVPVNDGASPDWQVVGPIVRRQAMAAGSVQDCRRRLGLDPDRRTLLVVGGSQGARSLIGFLKAFISAHPESLDGWQVLALAGKGADATIPASPIPVRVLPFLAEMGLAWGAADLAVTRAGAGSVAEVLANRVPAIFLPYPHHADEHQRHNAQPLADAGGAVITTDFVDPEANLAHVGPVLMRMLAAPTELDRMRRAMAALAPADGAGRAAALLLSHAATVR